MLNLKGSSCSFFSAPLSSSSLTNILPGSTLVTLALVIHLISLFRSSLSRSVFESPTPPKPMCPIYGSLVTKVRGTLLRFLRRRRSRLKMNANS